MPIGAVIGISAATAGTNIYSTKRAAGENRRAIEAQERMEREAIAAQERAEAEERALNQAQWDAYTKAMTPYWHTGNEAFGKLSGLLGLSGQVPSVPTGGGGGMPPASAPLFPAASVVAKAPPRTAPGGARFGRGREYAANVMQFPAQRTANPLGDLRSLADLYTLAGRGGIGQSAPAGVGRPLWV